jgi:Restriction alleviation protein Lar
MANKRRSKEQLQEIDALVERLREFTRLNYVTAVEIAREIGVRDSAVGAWLRGEKRPEKPELISNFLDSLPKERGSGVVPTGYEYREYKNWRGIPKLRRCPFCKQAKGEIRRSRGAFVGVCPNCDATGPKRESDDEALAAWNGRGVK